MPRLTAQHYNWLAVHVAPLLQEGKANEFANMVQEFGKNNQFKKAKFIDVSATSWPIANQPCQPEPIDDSIPYLETPHVINSKAA